MAELMVEELAGRPTAEAGPAEVDYARVERAIAFLIANAQDQPSLEAVAEVANLSPFHLQRVFTRWVGVSPKKFVQYLTLDYAKNCLDRSASVLDAAYEAGLSGPSRLHDLFVTIDAMTPGEFKRRGGGLVLRWGVHETPFGDCLLFAAERGLAGLAFLLEDGLDATHADLARGWENATFRRDEAATAPYAARIFGPAAADGAVAALPLLLRGTSFQLRVWEALLCLPRGARITYEGLATRLGRPEATRAVAGAVAANPVSYLIPCHRVIRKSGVISDYRWGRTRKAMLLGWEAARTDPARADPEAAAGRPEGRAESAA